MKNQWIVLRHMRAQKATGHVEISFQKGGKASLYARVKGINQGTLVLLFTEKEYTFSLSQGKDALVLREEREGLPDGRVLAAVLDEEGRVLLAGESQGAPEDWIAWEYNRSRTRQMRQASRSSAEKQAHREAPSVPSVDTMAEVEGTERAAIAPADIQVEERPRWQGTEHARKRADAAPPPAPDAVDAMAYHRLEWEEPEGNEPPMQKVFDPVIPVFAQKREHSVEEESGEDIPSPDLSSPGWQPLHTLFADIPPAREELPKGPVEPPVFDNLPLDEDDRPRWIPRKPEPLWEKPTPQHYVERPSLLEERHPHPPELDGVLLQWEWKRVEYETGDGFYYYMGLLREAERIIGRAVAIPCYGDADVPPHLRGFQRMGRCWVLAQHEEDGSQMDI
ncbi:hypothetical protein LJC20_04585 [Eubacteriales bacterium OttesenSCG-928-M02]|nr:hypothetical protein [Eubacteriales bacterium OttesenSCG-928-M02]